jgi:hypothetical protein
MFIMKLFFVIQDHAYIGLYPCLHGLLCGWVRGQFLDNSVDSSAVLFVQGHLHSVSHLHPFSEVVPVYCREDEREFIPPSPSSVPPSLRQKITAAT